MQKKLLIPVLLISFFSCSNSYKKLPHSFQDSDQLFKAINPNKNYTFWACMRGGFTKNDMVIYSYGKKSSFLKYKAPYAGFFTGCMPAMCFTCIVYEMDGKLNYVVTVADFTNFMGTIDNLEEAVLPAEATDDLSVSNDARGGSYFITDSVFNLKLAKYKDCPETEESIGVQINKKSGQVSKNSLGVYWQSKNCTVY